MVEPVIAAPPLPPASVIDAPKRRARRLRTNLQRDDDGGRDQRHLDRRTSVQIGIGRFI